MTIFDLPQELLDRVYFYLDWDRSTHLVPKRQDLLNISLTCKHLRHSVAPLLFRNVSLCLRWYQGILLEPTLFTLRRNRPDLTQHVRCVRICSSNGERASCRIPLGGSPTFKAPLDDPNRNWLGPELPMAQDDEYHVNLHAAHREAITSTLTALLSEVIEDGKDFEAKDAETILRELLHRTSHPSYEVLAPPGNKHYAESLDYADGKSREEGQIGPVVPIERWLQRSDPTADIALCKVPLVYQVGALATVMLCLPPTITEIVYEASTQDDVFSWQNVFGSHTAAAALRIFAPRIEHVTATSTDRKMLSWRASWNNLSRRVLDALTPEIIKDLTKLKSLVLAASVGESGQGLPRGCPSDYQLQRWTNLPAPGSLKSLEFWNIQGSDQTLDGLVNLVSFKTTFSTLLRY
jgi:hypothetical protein